MSEEKRALIVDDERDMAEFISEVAVHAGFSPVIASDPTILAEVLEPDPALIVLDLNMPGMDGMQVLRELSRRRSCAELVLVSGYGVSLLNSTRGLAEAQGLRVLGVLAKPIRAADLNALFAQHGKFHGKPVRGGVDISTDELRLAIQQKQIVLHYQPQVVLADGAWTGVEALARWQHPEKGLLFPDAFIPLVESSGLSLEFTLRVLESAVATWEQSAAALEFTGELSVNLPPVAMTDRNIPEQVLAIWERLRVGIGLQLEVTETSVPPDPVAALEILTRLRLKGIQLSVDDFGTGHSSLEQLRLLPFNELKIDMNFVRAAKVDAKSRAIVERSIQLGRDLGLTVLAEGVETDWHWHWLRESGCELAQGYFISKPLPIDGIAAWHANWKAPRRP